MRITKDAAGEAVHFSHEEYQAMGKLAFEQTEHSGIAWGTPDLPVEIVRLYQDGRIDLYGKPSTAADAVTELDRVISTLMSARAHIVARGK